MQNTSGTQSQNQPNRDEQTKGGQHSQQGGSHDSTKSPTNVNENDQRNENRPSNESPVKGGQPPRAGGNK
jgi:hypothetical protein